MKEATTKTLIKCYNLFNNSAHCAMRHLVLWVLVFKYEPLIDMITTMSNKIINQNLAK